MTEKIEYTAEMQDAIKQEGSRIFLVHRLRLLISSEEREYEANPEICRILANEIREFGFANITASDALILYSHLCGCKNFIIPKAEHVIKNTHDKEELTQEIFDGLFCDATAMKDAFLNRWICHYTDPYLKIWYYKLGLYYWNTVFAEIVKLRINGNTENFMPKILNNEI